MAGAEDLGRRLLGEVEGAGLDEVGFSSNASVCHVVVIVFVLLVF